MIELAGKLGIAVWLTFYNAAPYLLFGLFAAGLLNAYISREKIGRYLGKPGFASVLTAALFGVPLPLCSCGVLPAAFALRKSGASKGATLSFLISTPETGIDSIAISFALLDPIMAVFRPIAAFITAITAGIAQNILGGKETSATKELCPHCHNSSAPGFKQGMRYAFIELLGDTGKWLILGIAVSGLIAFLVPQSFIERYLGYGIAPMFIMLLAGIPMYVCASASTPIAAALILKGMSPGAALVFLLAGPATNTAGILTVGKMLGKKTAAIYLSTIAACSLLAGLFINKVYTWAGINAIAAVGAANEVLPGFIKAASAGFLMLMMFIIAGGRHSACDTHQPGCDSCQN